MTTATASRSAERRVWQLAALMAVLAVAVGVREVGSDPHAAEPTLVWWLLLPAFALAEIVVIHFPAQRSSHSHTFREIPAIIGLTLLPVPQYLTVYVLGTAVAVVLWSRLRGVKLAFNVAMFAVEAVLGAGVYHAVLAGTDPIAPRGWAAAIAAVLLTDLMSAGAVTAAISLTDGAFDGHVLREALRSGVAAASVNACVALLVVSMLLVRPSVLPLLGVVVVLLVLGYRFYVALSRDYGQMRLLYRFVGSAGRSADLDDVVAAVLSEAAHLLHASRSELVLLPSESTAGEGWTWADGRLTANGSSADVPGGWWEPALRGESVLMTVREVDGDRGGEGQPRDGVAVPLLESGLVGGVLMVADRSFEEETFTETDQRVLETMAAHVAVALDKARAVERLRRVAEERAFEALHDELTGLPNRRSLHETLEAALEQGRTGALLLLDLDDFQDVNSTLGHSAGDSLLIVTGQRLTAEAPGTVARLGGDDFAVLLLGVDGAAARDHAARLRQVVSEPVPLGEAEIVTATSIGIAEFGGGSCTAEELLARVDVALHAARSADDGIEEYRAADGDSTARRLALAADLPVALRDGGLQLFYQPQADAGSGTVTGFEALMRWHHPRFGMLPPPEVVAVAQRTGLMFSLTTYLLERALLERREWCRAGHDLDVAVNITPRDLSAPQLAQRVAELLRATGTPPGALVLEITESEALGDPERSIATLRELAAQGVRLSVDDFGTGYSSLAYLERLPVHEVKIDRSFVFRLERSEDATIVRATIGLAHDLRLRVVAEGVENDLARRLVTDLGCDLIQGYGLARPMPADEVLGWLQRRDRVAGASPARLAGRA